MRFYIATGLKNVLAHNQVRNVLVANGHEVTFDWTQCESVIDKGNKARCEIAQHEFAGVKAADTLIAVLKGGRGTHIEIGMALAWGKDVVIIGYAEDFYLDGVPPCAFYYLPSVRRIVLSETCTYLEDIKRRVEEYLDDLGLRLPVAG